MKIDSISVCIPFYETHDLTRILLDKIVNISFVSEIIVVDDCSKVKFQYNNPKVTIFYNTKNLGAYRNKFVTVSKSNNEWLLLLDSDNEINDEFFIEIKKFFNFDKNVFYLPKKLKLDSISGYGKELDQTSMEYDFEDDIFDLDKASQYLKKGISKIEWMLNTGNFIVNKDTYLATAQKTFQSNKSKYIDCDALVFSYQWLMRGNKIQLMPFYHTTHRLREYSWTNTAKNNWASQKYHIFLIKNKGRYGYIYLISIKFNSCINYLKNIIKKLINYG